MESIRIILIEKNPNLRHIFREILDKNPNILLVGEASTQVECIDLVESTQPEMVVLDMTEDVLELTRQLNTYLPPVKILVLTALTYRSFIVFLLDQGVDGVISKDQAIANLGEAIIKVAQGEKGYFSSENLPSPHTH